MLGIDNKVFQETLTVTDIKLDDTDGSNWLTLDWGENDTSDRSLTLNVNAGNRIIGLTGNLTVELASTLNQDLTTDAGVTFNTLSLAATSNQIILQSAGITGTLTATPTTPNKVWTLQDVTGTIYQTGGTDVAVADGGTNISTYAVGDLLYASTTGVLSTLPDVAVGSVLVSGGVNTAPAYASSVGIGIAPVAGTRLTLPLENDAVTPTLAFGDGDTGFHELEDDTISIAISGVRVWTATGTRFYATNGASLLNVTATAILPSIVPTFADLDTGLGLAAADQLSLIAGAIEGIRITEVANIIDVGVFGTFTQKYTVTTDNTNGVDTYTAAEMLGGLILRGVDDGITGAVIDVTATAAAIVAAIPGCKIGSGFEFRVSNRDATHTVSVDGGASVTMSPNDPSTVIPAGSTGTFLVVVTNATAASEAATIHCLGIVGH